MEEQLRIAGRHKDEPTELSHASLSEFKICNAVFKSMSRLDAQPDDIW